MTVRWIGLLLTAALAAAALGAPSDPDLEARLNDVDRRAVQVQDFTARFEQTRHTALLKKPLVSHGLVRMKGSTVRWDTEAPEPAVLHSDGREIKMFYPRQKSLEIYPIDRKLTDLAASPLPRLAALRGHFAIEPIELPREPASGEHRRDHAEVGKQLAVRLTPTDDFLKEHVDSVVVVLDVRGAYVRRVEMNDADGDRTLIRFVDVRLNTGLKDADVGLTVPPGTKVSRPLNVAAGRGGARRGERDRSK